MNQRQKMATVILASLAMSAGASDDDKFDASLGVTFVSDYVFRGISQTQSQPAAHGSLSVAHASGIYTEVWASTVSFADETFGDAGAQFEIDFAVGIELPVGERLSLDLAAVHYAFPGTVSQVDYSYSEFLATLNIRDTVSVMVGWTNDVFGMDAPGAVYEVASTFHWQAGVSLETVVGYYDLTNAYGSDYTYISAGVRKAFDAASVNLAWHGTGGSADALFGADIADGRIVVSVDKWF